MTVYRFLIDGYNAEYYITQNGKKMAMMTAGKVHRMLEKEASLGMTPEGKMWITVISETWADAAKEWRTAHKRRFEGEACKFFLFGRASHIANLIGWDGDMTEFFLRHHPRGIN